MAAEAKIEFDRDRANQYNNSIYFITEARITELLHTAGFSQVTKFYNAFLFGAWTAKFTNG